MKSAWSKVGIGLIIVIAVAWTSLPLYWMVITALKQRGAVFHYPPYFLPPRVTFENVREVIYGTKQINSALFSMKDSLIVALSNMALCLVIGTFAAYSISRFRTGGKNLSFWILSNRFLPPIALIIPLFVMYRFLGLLNNYLGLVLAYCSFNLPFTVWILMGFIEGLPVEVEESALIDGCTRVQVFFKIVIPLAAPGVVVAALLTFLFAWNEYIMALLITGKEITTLPVYIPTLRGAHDVLYGHMCAASIVSFLPGVVLAFFLSKYIAGGLTFGALK